MVLTPFFNSARATFLLLGLLGFVSNVRAQPPGKLAAEKDEFQRLAEVFALPAGTESIKDKSWVEIETGPANWKSEMEGWLIKDTPNEIQLLDWYGELNKLRKPATNEKRSAIKEEDDGRSSIEAADYSIAWQIRTTSYGAKSKKFLEDGMPKEVDDGNTNSSVNQRFRLADHVVISARHAHFSYQLGNYDLAAELYAHTLKAQKKYLDSYNVGREKPFALHEFVAEEISSRLHYIAVISGHNGMPRTDLQKKWERIVSIPHHRYRDEAKGMVKHYQKLIDEDARWIEPDAKVFAKLTTEQQTAYWLYHLRDLDAGQSWDPGRCDVLREFRFRIGDQESKKANAALELKKIGMSAIPQLIAHLDDERPTRCKGHWRSYWPEGHYLLRYGDCCQQIFEDITGHTVFRRTATVSYPIHDGEGKQCKERAEKWWQEYQKEKENGGK